MNEYISLSLILFTIGSVGVLVRRNAIVVFMCIELMLNATNLAFVSFSRQHKCGQPYQKNSRTSIFFPLSVG